MKRVWWLCLAVLLLVPTYALAQNAEETDFAERMNKAASILKNGDKWEALEAYLSIASLYSAPALSYSLGRTYQRLYQCTSALDHYYKVLTTEGIAQDSPVYTRTVKALDEMASCVDWGSLTIRCNARQAVLSIDDELIGFCKSKSVFKLPSGPHRVFVKGKDGEFKQSVNIVDGKQEELLVDIEPAVEPELKIQVEPHHYRYRSAIHPAIQWSLIGTGAAALIGSGFAFAYAYDSKVSAKNALHDFDRNAYESSRDDMDVAKYTAWTLVGVGGVLVLSGLSVWIANLIMDDEVEEFDAGVVADGERFALSVNYRF